MTQSRRRATGGLIDRSTALHFTVDGVAYEGFAGDTLVSALIANGALGGWRSRHLDRPRGIVGAWTEEPNAIVEVQRASGAFEPTLRATVVELVDGLVARRTSGRGRLSTVGTAVEGSTAIGRFDRRYVHTDMLVVGAGPAGLAAAIAAGQAGARVILVDDGPRPGGGLLATPDRIVDDAPAVDGISHLVSVVDALPELVRLARSTCLGLYDHGYAIVAERRTGFHGAPRGDGVVDGRLWHIRARRIVLATGALERPIVFAGNDRPGVMLASAAQTFANRYAVLAGERAVVITTNDDGLAAAADLAAAGIDVADVVDVRDGRAVVAAQGLDRVEAAVVRAIGSDGIPTGPAREIACDLIAVSGGWNPTTQLWTHLRGTTRWDPAIHAFVPDRAGGPVEAVGAGAGTFELGRAMLDGAAAGARAAARAGFGDGRPDAIPELPVEPARPPASFFVVPGIEREPEAVASFVDLERDVTVADLDRAVGAGLSSIEHVKRYTTVGTGSDQGRLSGTTAGAIVAALTGREPAEVGVSNQRPPVVPVSFAFLAGRDRGALLDPIRTTGIHAWHLVHDAVFEDVGQWKRPRYFPRAGESMDDAVLRECRAARESVAAMDASTLGKIDLQGPDVGAFLDRVYTNAFAKLAVGSCRYGLMCRLDGMVFDDGVTSRLAEDRFHMTTTTGNAVAVLDHLEEWLQTEWPTLRVRATSVTEQWATIAVVGPRARDVLRALAPDLALDPTAFPFMTWRDAVVAGIAARIYRISFSGELAYEINVPSWFGLATWEAVMAAGAPFGIAPYGTEAMHVLRAEKGYPIVGQDTDGTTTPQDLGMDWIVSKKKPFIGSRSHRRPDTMRTDRKQLVGLLPLDRDALLPEGAQLVDDPAVAIPMPMVGHVTSSYRSAALGRTFALALVRSGRERLGEVVHAPLLDGRVIATTIVDSELFDPQNTRRDGDGR
ncbi:MAG: 2Fe-2S iron-sulfur cluster-binding protein [Candidatus Limnocylindrales bacterium]